MSTPMKTRELPAAPEEQGTDVEHRGGVGALNMTLMAPFRTPFGQTVFGDTDYPHSEGAFGYGRTSVRAVVDATSADDARAILGGMSGA